MANSPLKWFRKNEKLLLAVFGVALMLVFSLGAVSLNDILGLTGNSGGGGANGPVVASWTGGSLSERELDELRFCRSRLFRYCAGAFQVARDRGAVVRTNTVPSDVSDGALLELALLSRQAQEMGIAFTDQAVVDYLLRFTDGKLKKSELLQIWTNSTAGSNSEQELLSWMRRELMAMQVRGMLQSGIRPVSPLHKWEQYNRMERRVSAEVVELPVADFVAKVGEPSDAELKEFFDEYKGNYAVATSPTPGFRVREKAAFEYIKFDRDKFFEAEMAKVPQEEIEKYYNENKEQFRELSFLEDDLRLDVPEAIDPADMTNEANEPVESEVTTESEMLDVDAPETEGSSSDESTTQEGSDEELEEESSGKSDSPAGSPTADEADTSTESDPPANPPQPTPTPSPQEESAEPTESDELSETTAPSPSESESTDAKDGTDEAGSGETESDDQPPAIDSDLEVDAEEGDEEAKYKPLEKVEDEIRRELAGTPATERFDRAIAQARNLLEKYYKEREYYNIQVAQKQDAQLPEFPDLSGVDSPEPIVVEKLPLTDAVEIAETEIGKSFDARFNGQSIDQIFFPQIAFDKGQPLYNPRQFPKTPLASATYLYWKTEKQESYEPPFDEVREQVIESWKKKQAVDLAKVEAEKLIEKANAAEGQSLVESLERESFEIDESTWITGGNIPGDRRTVPQFTQIAGIENPSIDVYQTLFGLEIGKAGYALNFPEDRVYIFKPTSQSPEIDIRRAGFVQNAPLLAGLEVLEQRDWRNELVNSYQRMMKEKNVEWERQPEAMQQ